ncbi:MAG TPA: hypothetical protein VGM90_23160 [Kofleriaceae bacterium]|jgi:hypothetical protein
MRVCAAAIALVLACPALAHADDAGDQFAGEGLFRPPIEWSTWLRASYGMARERDDSAARTIGPTVSPEHTDGHRELGAGIEASLPLSPRGNLRLGGWAELTDRNAAYGAELVITRVPKRMDMFLYEGHGILALRAGRSSDERTFAIAYGYVAPYWLEGDCKVRFYGIETGVCKPRPERAARYMAGVRLVATVAQTIDDPHAWSATFGIELEPVGALRMLTVARSWY